MNDNVRHINGKGKPQLSKENIEKMKEELPLLLEFFSIQARWHRGKYDALIAEGFTEEQALELSKSII